MLESILTVILFLILAGVYFMLGYIVGKTEGHRDAIEKIKEMIKEIDKSAKENISADQNLPGYSDWAQK